MDASLHLHQVSGALTMISRASILAVLTMVMLTDIHKSASAQPDDVRPLTYQEICDVAKWAIREKQVHAAPPELFSTETEDGTREYLVLLGDVDVLNAFPFADFPAESIFKTQVKLEQFRQRWTRDERLYAAVVHACENAEPLLNQTLVLAQQKVDSEDSLARFQLIAANKTKVWQGLHDAISNWAREKGCRFIGFSLSSRSMAWQAGSRVPFEHAERTYASSGGLPLEGPDGVEVRIMPNLRRKLFEIRMTPRDDWDWNITQVLKIGEPSVAFVEIGGIYYMSARVGEKVRDTEFHVQPTDKKIQVILPAN